MILPEALEEILACPNCHGSLAFDGPGARVVCLVCGRAYPIVDNIPILLCEETLEQKAERQFRENFAQDFLMAGKGRLLEVVGQHHCIPVMRACLGRFLGHYRLDDWLVDIGVGWGWHWEGHGLGPRAVGIDMSLSNLRVARHLLGDASNVALICADAARLPLKANSVAGVWSVQVFQHFPDTVLLSALLELERVLTDEFQLELYNLNPAPLHRLVYRLMGKPYHLRGRRDWMELNRRSGQEWAAILRRLRGGTVRVSWGYSELFFHPDLRLRPRSYPMAVERLISRWPTIAAQFARQVQVSVTGSRRGVDLH